MSDEEEGVVVRVNSDEGCGIEEQFFGEAILVRHGARYDEKSYLHWLKWNLSARSRRFDPPLTNTGKEQARTAAVNFQETYGEKFHIDRIYASALQRTLETAEQFSIVLGLPVQVVYGLSECAAGVRKRNKRGTPTSELPLRSMSEIRALCPQMNLMDEIVIEDPTFLPTVNALTTRDRQCLFITHREGVRDLYALEGKRLGRIPYCATAHFRYYEKAASSSSAVAWRYVSGLKLK